MKNIIGLVVLLGFTNILIAKELPSQACLSLDTNQIESCLDNAYGKWDKQLNENYKNVMGYLSKAKKTELRNQQRDWIKERDQKCSAFNTENDKKACLVDETKIKSLALEDQEIEIMPKAFEGVWKNCLDTKDKQDVCIEQVFFQKGRNVCGWWEDGEGDRVSSRRIQLVLIATETAKSRKICEEFDFSSMTDCYLDENEEVNRPFKDWEINSDFAMKICNGKLYRSKSFILEKNCQELSLSLGNKYSHSISINNYDKKDTSWLTECLNYKDK